MENELRIRNNTLSYLIPDVCKAIVEILTTKYVKVPNTEEEWRRISLGFLKRWQYPRALGACDGKHFRIICPPNSGSKYYTANKNHYSVIVITMVDADMKILYYRTGIEGSANDSTILMESDFKEALDVGTLNLPEVPEDQIPFHFLGDNGYSLSNRVMVPFITGLNDDLKATYNYRHSLCRHIVENGFGFLTKKISLFEAPMRVAPHRAEIITSAAAVLHNFMLTELPPPRGPTFICNDKPIYINRVHHDPKEHPHHCHQIRNALCDFFVK